MKKTTSLQVDPTHFDAITALGDGNFAKGIRILGRILVSDTPLAQTIKDIPTILKNRHRQEFDDLCDNVLGEES